jgi:NAD(P)-dependent dehydrogenase (short-subunit alcohol dehydrogenase family)
MKWPEELNFMVNSRKKQHISTESMKGSLAVVSGSTSGVGLNAIRHLAKAQSDIVMVVRNKAKAEIVQAELESTYSVKVDIVIADFTDLESIRKAAEYINRTYKKVDVLINSVGIHSTKKIVVNGIEKSFLVNHLSIFLFTELLLPKMKESAPSRIIQVNSEGHRFGSVSIKNYNFKGLRLYTGLRGYAQSKTAQQLCSMIQAEQVQGTGVTINCMHPGAVKTAIGSNNGILYRLWFKYVTSLMLKDVDISGSALHYLASSKDLEHVSGRFFNLTIDEVPAKHARNKEKAPKVYQLSKELVGL